MHWRVFALKSQIFLIFVHLFCHLLLRKCSHFVSSVVSMCSGCTFYQHFCLANLICSTATLCNGSKKHKLQWSLKIQYIPGPRLLILDFTSGSPESTSCQNMSKCSTQQSILGHNLKNKKTKQLLISIFAEIPREKISLIAQSRAHLAPFDRSTPTHLGVIRLGKKVWQRFSFVHSDQ